MPENSNNNSIGNFSDLDADIIIKEDDDFKLFSHGNISEFVFKSTSEKQQTKAVLDTGLEEEMLAPLTPVRWDKNAAFYFDFEDEEEIQKAKKKVSELNKSENKKYSLHKIVDKLIETSNLNFVAELEKRFASIVFSYIRNTRSKLDVMSLFIAPINRSGLGLSEPNSNQLMTVLSDIKNKIEDAGGTILKDVEDEKKIQEPTPILSNMDPRQKIEKEQRENNIPYVARVSDSSKQKMFDVKKNRQVISPIQELAEITLTIFRRLSDNPIDAAQRIINKIYSFEKESFVKRAMAVKYWRQSEVYRLYLEIGKLSMEKNIPIEKIIEQKILAHEKTLTNEEFKAVSDLNKKIRF